MKTDKPIHRGFERLLFRGKLKAPAFQELDGLNEYDDDYTRCLEQETAVPPSPQVREKR